MQNILKHSWLMQTDYFIDTNIPALFINLNCQYNKMCICAYVMNSKCDIHIMYFSGVCDV